MATSTTFSTPLSTLKTNANGTLVSVGTKIYPPGGILYTDLQLDFGPATGGSFTEGGESGDITGGSIFTGHADVGVNLLPGLNYWGGPILGYGFFNENLHGTLPGLPGSDNPINNQTWQSLRVGGAGGVALPGNVQLSGSAVFLPWLQTGSGAFTGTGNGFEVKGTLSTPIPGITGLRLAVSGAYSDMSASGTLPLPGFGATLVDTKNNNWQVGIALNRIFLP